MRVEKFIGLLALLGLTAQAADLPIGGVPLSIGMEQHAAMKTLDAHLYVIPVKGNTNAFFVSDAEPPNISVIGNIIFKDGRLDWIQREWGHFSGTSNPVEVSKALFSAIESAKSASGESAVVSTTVQRIPGAEFKTIYFSFPGRRVSLGIIDGDAKSTYGQQVNINESVSSKY